MEIKGDHEHLLFFETDLHQPASRHSPTPCHLASEQRLSSGQTTQHRWYLKWIQYILCTCIQDYIAYYNKPVHTWTQYHTIRDEIPSVSISNGCTICKASNLIAVVPPCHDAGIFRGVVLEPRIRLPLLRVPLKHWLNCWIWMKICELLILESKRDCLLCQPSKIWKVFVSKRIAVELPVVINERSVFALRDDLRVR